jgi:hypothetical protein
MRVVLMSLCVWLCGQAFAQDPVNGRRLYVTPFTAGAPSTVSETEQRPATSSLRLAAMA